MTQYSFEDSAKFAKAAGFSTGGDPSPAGVIVAIAACQTALHADPQWYVDAYTASMHGHVFSMFPCFSSGKYHDFVDTADQVVKTGSSATSTHIGIGDVGGAAGDTAGAAADSATQLADALGGLTSALDPLKSLSALADIAGLVAKGAAWVADRHNWNRILQILLGAAGIYVGITIIRTDLQDIEGAAGMAALAAA